MLSLHEPGVILVSTTMAGVRQGLKGYDVLYRVHPFHVSDPFVPPIKSNLLVVAN